MATTADKRRGRTQRSKTATARVRAPNLDRYYGRTLPPLSPGDFTFELSLLKILGRGYISIDKIVESFEWEEQDNGMVGSLSLRRPEADAASVPVKSGDRVRCRVRWAGRWYSLWTMRAQAPGDAGDTATTTVTLTDDMDLLDRTKRHWHIRATKHHPHGYFGHDVVRLVARREGIRLGRVAACTHRNPKLSMYASALAVIKAAYQYETKRTGRKFVIRIRDGKLEVVPYERNAILYVLADEIRTSLVQQHPGSPNPASVLTGVARVGKGKDAKTIRYTAYSRDVIKRIGKVEREKHYRNIRNRAELRQHVQRDLAKMLRLDLTATIQHQGIPFVRRGDGIKIDLPSEYFSGTRRYVYVTAARHQVQAATFTSEFDVTTHDPFLAYSVELEKAQRARTRRKRKRGHG